MIVSRREAIRKDLEIFYVSPCKHGHTDGRFVSNSKCIKCFYVNKKYYNELEQELIYLKNNSKLTFREIMLPHVKKARADFSVLISRIKKDTRLNNCSHLGYTANDLKLHVEKLFKDGMSWSNHGEWEFDHIIPIYKYTLYVPTSTYSLVDFSILVNKLDNIQPLWKIENQRKSYKF